MENIKDKINNPISHLYSALDGETINQRTSELDSNGSFFDVLWLGFDIINIINRDFRIWKM